MKKLSSLTLFFPALNDGRSLPYIINRAFTVAPLVAKKYEVIIIDDGSHDETKEVIETAMKYYKHLSVVRHTTNLGYGSAIREGFARAKYEWVFYTDGDGQYDPEELARLVPLASSTVDVVNGYKLARNDPWFRKVIGRIYNLVSHREYTLPIRDVQCDFRLIRTKKLKKITLNSSSGLICLELVHKLTKSGARFVEVGVHHYPRLHGVSQFFRPKNLWRTLHEHVELWRVEHSWG